jgi:ribosomal protection tetracycline resistance protein
LRTLNLGIVAHVDAGKTSLTERLLYNAGVIAEIGSVDAGSTQTDTLALERQRGITIKSAVVSFAVGGVTVNLIDTPGHPDFIAEVERVLGVLDGAVLVISAVEVVQAQTRVLMRTLRRLSIPTVIFVNKIDRGGAGYDRVLRDISAKLTPEIVAMGTVAEIGSRQAAWTARGPADDAFTTRLADLLAGHDDALLAAYVADETSVTYRRLRRALRAQTRRALVHPVFFGSAITGAGVASLTEGLAELLPSAAADDQGPASGAVFKVERGAAGEKIAYLRMFSGQLGARDVVLMGSDREAKVTGLSVFQAGPATPGLSVRAGQIAKVRGLADVQVGDTIGEPRATAAGQSSPGGTSTRIRRHTHRPAGTAPRILAHDFAPPTLETVVSAVRPADNRALHAALTQLAEQDPLINLRQDDLRQELLVSLYGEVQKEVIQATLAAEFGLDVAFRESTTICIERPVGTGSAAEFMGHGNNPFRATVGLRLEPAAEGSGVQFGLEVEAGSMPFAFIKAVEETVRDTLREGLHGWQVTDCQVLLTHSGYTPPPPYGWSKWSSSAGDFRNLTPLVLMTALQQAGTVVCEPLNTLRTEVPADCVPALLTLLGRLGATSLTPDLRGPICVIEGEITAGRAHQLQQQLPGLTRGEGMLETQFARYQPVRGEVPDRPRTDRNPLNRKEYLLHVQRIVGHAGP